MITPVIIAGGSGKRLWPLSTPEIPKQFIKLSGDQSLFQNTLLRIKNLENSTRPIVICNEEHRFIVKEQLDKINLEAKILLEPASRNTSPAILLSILEVINSNVNAMAIFPADHDICNIEQFITGINEGLNSLVDFSIITFGIKPQYPNTGYGYIKTKISPTNNTFKVQSFTEKPNRLLAEKLIKEGCFWNSGIFVISPIAILKKYKELYPNEVQKAQKAFNAINADMSFFRIGQEYKNMCQISFDFAIVEKSQEIGMVELKSEWNDLGSWDSIYDNLPKDESFNVTKGNVACYKSSNNLIFSNQKRLSLVGINDLIVVNSDNAILISQKGNPDLFQEYIEEEQKNKLKHQIGVKIYRPWGSYSVIDFGDNYLLKKITVIPGERLSLQKHNYRSEHWVVIQGSALVKKDNETFELNSGESTFIPLGSIHSLENNGQVLLEIIETQLGTEISEDDIVRFEDLYGRIGG